MSPSAFTRARALTYLAGGTAVCSISSVALAQAPTTLRVAISPAENAAEAYYAKDMGFWAKAGINITIQRFPAAPAIVPATISNAVDIGWSTVDVLAAAHQKAIPITIIAPAADYSSPITQGIAALILPATSPVRQAKDLNGKIIAVPALHSIAAIGLREWLDKNGGDSTSIKYVEIPFPAMPAALDAGRVDAAWEAEPFVGIAKKGRRVLAYGFDGIAKRFLIAAWFTTPQWANEHRDLISRFATVIHETAVWANENPKQSGEILAKYTKISPTVIATMTRSHFAEDLSAALMQPLIDASAKYNGFSPFPAQELIYQPH